MKIFTLLASLVAMPAMAASNLTYDFDSNTPTNIFGGSYVTTGSVIGVQAAPNTTKFLNTIGIGGFYLDNPIYAKNLRFELGSPDNYNSFEILGLNDKVLYTRQFSGNGNWNVVRNIMTNTKDLGPITGLRFTSTSPAMEVDNIVFNDITNVVPEPQTWAMLIVGFGLIGIQLRKNEKKIKYAIS